MHSYIIARLTSLPPKYLDRNRRAKRQGAVSPDKLRSRLAHGHAQIAIKKSPPSRSSLLWNNRRYQRTSRILAAVEAIMASSKPHLQFNHPALGAPLPPQSPRTLRKFQSHQQLSSNSPSLIAQQRQQLQRNANAAGIRGNSDEIPHYEQHTPASTAAMPSHGRSRSNSDVAISSRSSLPGHRQSGSGRKFRPSLGASKRSTLDNLLRDGPPNGNVEEGLQELRYLVLSNCVDSDSDGMVRFPSQCFETKIYTLRLLIYGL